MSSISTAKLLECHVDILFDIESQWKDAGACNNVGHACNNVPPDIITHYHSISISILIVIYYVLLMFINVDGACKTNSEKHSAASPLLYYSHSERHEEKIIWQLRNHHEEVISIRDQKEQRNFT